MNLSCGNCKTIRSFSGDPLTCEVCGWVCQSYDTPYWQELRAKRQQPLVPSLARRVLDDVRLVFIGLVKFTTFCIAVVGISYLVYSVFQSEQSKLATKYGIPEERVFVQPKPHGCDFADAPLGDKHCHYEKEVSTIRWATSTVGNPIISYDDGKTWSVFTPDEGAKVPHTPTIRAVYVSWKKVEE